MSASTFSESESERRRFAEAGLDLMGYGASGIVRPLIKRALAREGESARLRSARPAGSSPPSTRAA